MTYFKNLVDNILPKIKPKPNLIPHYSKTEIIINSKKMEREPVTLEQLDFQFKHSNEPFVVHHSNKWHHINGMTAVNVYDKEGNWLTTGTALCSDKDNFCKKKGRKVAVRRAIENFNLSKKNKKKMMKKMKKRNYV